MVQKYCQGKGEGGIQPVIAVLSFHFEQNIHTHTHSQ